MAELLQIDIFAIIIIITLFWAVIILLTLYSKITRNKIEKRIRQLKGDLEIEEAEDRINKIEKI